jgi:Permuted papain-like amidase enzyme, YaeF/YiiX, C92 family
MAQDFDNFHNLNTQHPKIGYETAYKKYQNDVRENLKTGDLIFFSGYHWLSGLIRWRTKSGFSHVGMVVKLDEIDKVFLIESVIGNGVRIIPFSAIFLDYEGHQKGYNGRVMLASNSLLTAEKRTILKEKSLDFLTRQYDKKEYIRVFWRMIVGKMRIYPDRKFTCSELIYECYKAAGIKLEYESGDSISPGVLYRNESIVFKEALL